MIDGLLLLLLRGAIQGAIGFAIVWLIVRVARSLPASSRAWMWRLAGLKFAVAMVAIVPVFGPEQPHTISNTAIVILNEVKNLSEPVIRNIGAGNSLPRRAGERGAGPRQGLAGRPEIPREFQRPSALLRSLTDPKGRQMDDGRVRDNDAESWPANAFVLAVWLTGVVIAWGRLGRQAVLAGRMRRRLDGCPDGELFLATIARSKRPIPVRSSREAQVPMLLRVIWPVIVLPSDMSNEHREAAIVHEWAHYVRRDAYWAVILRATAGLFWFAPPAAWAAREASRAAEEACDGLTLEIADIDAVSYAGLLVTYARAARRPELALGLSSPGKALANRIRAISRKRSARVSLPLLAMTTFAVGMGLVPWAAATKGRGIQASGIPAHHAPKPAKSKDPYPPIIASMNQLAGQIAGNQEIQENLGFAPGQKLAIQDVVRRFDHAIRDFGNQLEDLKKKNVSDVDRVSFDNERRPGLFRRFFEDEFDVLTPVQRTRARQIAMQVYGERCLSLFDLAREVGLSETQRRQIYEINQDVRRREAVRQSNGMGLFPTPDLGRLTERERARLKSDQAKEPTASGKERIRIIADIKRLTLKASSWRNYQPKLVAAHKRWQELEVREQSEYKRDRAGANTKIRALLTTEQLRKFDDMKGAPFEIPKDLHGV